MPKVRSPVRASPEDSFLYTTQPCVLSSLSWQKHLNSVSSVNDWGLQVGISWFGSTIGLVRPAHRIPGETPASTGVAGCGANTGSPHLLQARWMTAAALFFLRNSSFLLRSLWMICSRSSTGRRSMFTLCPERGPEAGCVSLGVRASSDGVDGPAFLTPGLNASVLRGGSE